MNTPQRMTGAELQTLRESAGLSRESLAELLGVEARSVKHWETRPSACPPDDAAQIAAQASRWVATAAREALAELLRQPGAPGALVALVRYRETAHMLPSGRAQGWHADTHGAMVARLLPEALARGINCRAAWFDPAHYRQWMQAQHPGSADTETMRSEWARAAVEIQSQPKRADPASDSANQPESTR